MASEKANGVVRVKFGNIEHARVGGARVCDTLSLFPLAPKQLAFEE